MKFKEKNMKYKSALERKYKQKLSLDLTAKEIVYFCRDALSYGTKPEEKVIYEKEILNLMKSKDWDLSYKDIDGNNLLSYPIYNNAFDIVKYLIDNKLYNLQEYNQENSHAVCACIMLTGEKMMNYLVSLDINKEYLTDMTFRAYSMSSNVMPEYKISYMNKASYLIEHTDFEKILSEFLKVNEFDKYKEQYLVFLQEHPLELENKVKIIQAILTPLREKKNFIERVEKYKILDSWVNYFSLKEKFPNKEIADKKPKI